MSKNFVVTALVLGCLVFTVGNAQAYSKIPANGLRDAPLQQDSRLNETVNTAQEIWDRLTEEFVEFYDSGQYARATASVRSAYQLSMAVFGPNHINTADSMLKLGILAETLGDTKTAKTQMQNSLKILETQLGPNHEDVAVVLTNLANVYFEDNEPELSKQYHMRALTIRRQVYGEKDANVAQSLYNLAVLYDDLLDYDKAVDCYEHAINIWNVTLGPVHPYVANALNNLANIYMAQNKLDKAEILHTRSLAIRKLIYGPVHAEVARSLINLGALYVKENAYEKAKPVYREAVAVAEKLFGPSHPQVAMLLYSLANIYHIQGRMDLNEEQQLTTQKVNFNQATTDAKEITSHINNLHHSSQEYFAKALPLYERALEILDNTIGADHPAMSAMLSELALLYKSVGKINKAEQLQVRLSHIH